MQAAGPPDTDTGVDYTVRVEGPASLSNLGPGFDTLGLCISGFGDVIELAEKASPGIAIEFSDSTLLSLPFDEKRNTASVAANCVFTQAGYDGGAYMRIRKGIPFGSGIGGSAASAVAGAWAANLLIGTPFGKEELVEAVLEGEAIASHCKHGDNVLPALFGGMVLVSSTDPARYRRIEFAERIAIAVLVPEVEILTQAARALLPPVVAFRDAVHNASELAFLVAAVQAGDWEGFGRAVMEDRLVEPHRARLVPCYNQVRAAALDAGAFGCALTGSGPAMFAVCPSFLEADDVLKVMTDAAETAGVQAAGKVVAVNMDGVKQI